VENDAPKVLRVQVTVNAPPSIITVAGFFYRGKLWIAPTWLDTPDGKWTTPARIICVDAFPREADDGQFHDWILNYPISTALFDDPIPLELQAEYEILERPVIWFPIPSEE
jgi:hypothetical protein